jgi:hypothetical protein
METLLATIELDWSEYLRTDAKRRLAWIARALRYAPETRERLFDVSCGVHTTFEPPLGELCKETLDRVEPQGGRWREMECPTWIVASLRAILQSHLDRMRSRGYCAGRGSKCMRSRPPMPRCEALWWCQPVQACTLARNGGSSRHNPPIEAAQAPRQP